MPGLSAPHETEWSLLLAACSDLSPEEKTRRIGQLLGSPIQWNALRSFAENNGVLPIVTQALLCVGEQIPAETLAALKQSYQANLHKALFLSREFVRIVACLSEAGVEFMPYKGLALAETIYGDIALRQSGDIDLLIRGSDLPRVRAAVSQLGYAPHLKLSHDEEEAYLKSGYECAFDGAAGRNLVEVQWAIQPHFYAVDLDMEGLFRRAHRVTVAGTEVKALSAEDLFIVLALHAAKHVWGKLIWVCDLARMSKLPSLKWNWIGARARELGIARILRITLLLAQELLEASLPGAAIDALGKDRRAGPLVGEIRSFMASEKSLDVESLGYFRLMLQLRERPTDRIRFVSRLVFTPGPNEWAVTRLPRPLFPFYRMVRITRLAARMVSGRI